MGVIFLIVLIALALSLYDFFSTRDTNRLSAKVAAEKNQKYGAYAIQKSYNIILSLILLGFLVLSGAYFAFEKGFGFGFNNETPPKREKIDTFLLTINAPPVEHIETLPPSYRLSGKEGTGTPSPASRQQAEPPSKDEKEPEKAPENKNTPEPEKAPKSTAAEKPAKPKKYSSIEEQIRAEERKMFEDAGGEAKRAEIRRKAEEDKKRRDEEQKRRNAAQTQQSQQNAGGNNGSKGQPMVNFVLDGRTPHNNDYWNIRNPGYTCGQGISGKVVIKIKVNGSGNVTSAVPVNPGNLNQCLIDQATAYAKMSRFNTSSTQLQEGTITYVFAP